MKKVALEYAVGEVLGHDITEVNMEQGRKGVAFRRGHVVEAGDLEAMRNLGKMHIYVWEGSENQVHEDDAARILAPLLAGEGLSFDPEPHEGKIAFYAEKNGIFKVDVSRLERINALAIPSLPTIHNNFPVTPAKQVAAFRIIPLSCAPGVIEHIKSELLEPLLYVKPYEVEQASILVTGNEVYHGHIRDDFTPKLRSKLGHFGVEISRAEVLPDVQHTISRAVNEAAARTRLVLVTGGTSVDPDDVTVQAMEEAGVMFPFQGNPIQPGNNMTIGYKGNTIVVAVPAAALFFATTALDIFLPRMLAGERIEASELVRRGHGGLCHFCARCVYPVCPFGAGE
ncbi:MAG: molybdopterin-binding protein [Desulfuromonadaceae bacterium]